jgi:surface antigen
MTPGAAIAPPATSPAPSLAIYREAPANGLTCVPYARQRSGIALKGDAYRWWDNAAGLYQRGNQPAPGAILVLPQTARLKSGHVAVVAQLVTARQILVDHANWIPGEIATNMPVVDVSPDNDWTQLRFWNAPSRTFGAIYPASGFIYAENSAPTQMTKPASPLPSISAEDPDPTVIISGSGVSFGSP